MRLINLLCCLLLVFSTAYSQTTKFQISNETKILGKNYINNSDIEGVEYVFPERIEDYFLDPSTNFLTVRLRGLTSDKKWLKNTGNILQYDLKNKKVLWSKHFSYLWNDLVQFSKTMIYTNMSNSYKLDPYTGKDLWRVKNKIFLAYPNIGVGYKYNAWLGYVNRLEGIDLINGKRIWKRKTAGRWHGMSDLFYINDSTLLMVSFGLLTINKNTGMGWDYFIVTNADSYSGLMSNVIADSTFVYMASSNQLVKLDKQFGNVAWKFPFRHNLTTKSTIFMDDSLVYMINRGFGFRGRQQVNCGRAFVAAFDRQTGAQKYFTLINKENGSILDLYLLKKEIILLFQNKMMKYNLETGTEISEKEFPEEDFGELRFFIGQQVFIDNQHGYFFSLAQNDSTNLHIYTNEKKIVSVNNHLNVMNTIELEDTGICYLHVKDYKFIASEKKTFIINNEGKKIAELEITKDAFLIEDILYDIQDRSFIAIDTKTLNLKF